MKKLPILLFSILLAGCATTAQQCDPSNKNMGFIGKIQCDAGGGYADSVRKNEQALIDARLENQHFQDIYLQIAAQQRDTRASLQVQKERNNKLNQSLSSLLNQVKAKHGNKAGIQQQMVEVEKKLNSSQNAPTSSAADVAVKQAELQQLQRQLQRLQLSLGYE